MRFTRRKAAAVGRQRSGAQIPLRAYVIGLVVLFVALAGANIVYQRHASLSDARQTALADARYAARVAAREVAAALAGARAQVAAVAAQPAIGQAFGPSAETGCTLQFGGAGPFTAGHIDFVRSNGTVTCSSLRGGERVGYADATWLAAAMRTPLMTGPVVDGRTGGQAVVVTAPVPGHGAVAVFLDVAAPGPALAAELGGAGHREFVITAASGAVVLARSIRPGYWAGRPVTGTPFAAGAGQEEHADLDGTLRLYGQAVVPMTGWRVFAGASAAATFAAANTLSNQQILITLAGLAVLCAAALVLYKRTARPIAVLAAAVRAATAHLPGGPVPVVGPAEVSALAGDVNQLLSAASRELEARSQLAAIAESSSDAILGVSLDGTVTSWNAAAERTFGYSRQEMTGNSISVIGVLGRGDSLRGVLEQIAAGEPVMEMEATCLRRDKTVIDVAYALSPVRDASGAVTGGAAVARDVTERNHAEAERRALEHRLQQAERLESLGRLASGIAHDFNNLLSAILNYAGFAAEQTSRPDVRADIEQIQAAAERAARLTRQLLIFARREPARLQPLDLNAVVEDMQNLLARSIGTHIELAVLLGTEMPAIEADRGQVEQVLLNLAINARDAMADGGVLTIKTGPAELDEAYVSTHPGARPGRYAELTVADTGSGMSAEVINHVFDPFFTTKAEGQGTGLGLSTVYGIITGAGGIISVEAAESAGTTFRLHFPAAAAGPATVPEGAAPAARGSEQTILVVDDEPAVLSAAARILRQNGYATLEAANHDQALALAASREFQLLVTDSVMPHMSGATLAQHVTQLRPGLPVIYMSGYSPAAADTSPGADQAVSMHLQKPFTAQALLQVVYQALNTD